MFELKPFSTMSVPQQLYQWLAQGELERTINALVQIAEQSGDEYFQKDAIHLAGRFFRLAREQEQGIVETDFYTLQRNQIQAATQALIARLPENAMLPNSATPPPTQLAEGKTTTENRPTPPIAWILGTVLLLGTAVALIGFLPCPTPIQETAARLLMALGAAGIATVLPGLFQIHLKPIQAGSAIGVFALVYLVNPARVMTDDSRCNQAQTTAVTVFVHGKQGRQDMILRQQGYVVMDVRGGERKRASINENGQAFFQNLEIGDSVELNVDFSEPYKATKPNKKYVIEDEGSIYLETVLQGLDKIFGTVLDGDAPLPGVLVSIGALRDTTNDLGYYEILIPENLQQKQQEVKFIKRGYTMITKKAYPQFNVPLNIVLSK